jgi:hypothetical protein
MSGSGGGLVAGYLDIANPTGWVTSGHGGAATTTSMTYTNLLNSNLPSGGNTYHLTVGTVNTLPNPIVPVYSRLANANVSNPAVGGNWNDAASWTVAPDGMGAALSAAPYGVPVVILAGARINTNVNGRQAFTSRINGLLVVGTSYGHNIGAITGTGTLRTNTNTFPAGNYTGFVSSAGGTIEYVGPMTMNNRSTYNNVSIIGTGNVTMTNTDLILNGSMSIASGATLNNNTNNRNIALARNWSNSGTFVPGTATVTFNGAATQTVTGTTAFNNLTVSKSAGNLTLNGSGTTSVNSILALTNGNIVSSASHLLVLGSSATISGGGANSFVSGPMRKPIASGGSFAFPLGSVAADYYRPATLSNTSNADTWTLEYVGHNPTDDGYPNETMNTTNIAKVSMFEYWNISRAGTASANVTITYNTGSYIPSDIGDVANLRVVRWDGTQWDLPPGAGSFSQTGTNITGTVTVTDVTSFSPFTFGSLDILSPLPVSWLYFTARRVDKNVVLNWKTALETNNDRFEIERSLNGTDFSRIGTISVNGANPNGKEYSFIDSEASVNAKYYYRIRQVDFDGVEDYSNIALVLPAGEVMGKRWMAYPNPMASNETFVLEEIDPVLENEVEVALFSANGT